MTNHAQHRQCNGSIGAHGHATYAIDVAQEDGHHELVRVVEELLGLEQRRHIEYVLGEEEHGLEVLLGLVLYSGSLSCQREWRYV